MMGEREQDSSLLRLAIGPVSYTALYLFVHVWQLAICICTHFPPNFPHHVDLEKSLTPNWLPPAEVLNNPRRWTMRKFVPWTSDWNEAFDARQRHLFKH